MDDQQYFEEIPFKIYINGSKKSDIEKKIPFIDVQPVKYKISNDEKNHLLKLIENK